MEGRRRARLARGGGAQPEEEEEERGAGRREEGGGRRRGVSGLRGSFPFPVPTTPRAEDDGGGAAHLRRHEQRIGEDEQHDHADQ